VTRNSWALAMGGVLALAAALAVLLYPVCTIENVLGTSYLTPDAKWSVTIYSQTCSRRCSIKNRENWIVALRPMSEPAPQPADYSHSEVVFEVEKVSPGLEVGVSAPSSWTQFEYLSEDEKLHSFLGMCYPDCPLTNIRKQLHSWNGIPVHYVIEEKPDGKQITQ
jgi:hypothetical protein